MVKMLKESYDIRLFQLKNDAKSRNGQLTSEDEKNCEIEAKKIVCETGINKNQFRHFLDSRYEKSIEHEAIVKTVELGIREGLLQWSSPRSYDSETGLETRNIVLTDRGFAQMNDPSVVSFIALIHSTYSPKLGRK